MVTHPSEGKAAMRVRVLAAASMGIFLTTGFVAEAHDYSGYDRARRFNRFLHEEGIPHAHGQGYGRGYSRGGYHEYLHEEGIPHGGFNHYLHDNGVPHFHDD